MIACEVFVGIGRPVNDGVAFVHFHVSEMGLLGRGDVGQLCVGCLAGGTGVFGGVERHDEKGKLVFDIGRQAVGEPGLCEGLGREAHVVLLGGFGGAVDEVAQEVGLGAGLPAEVKASGVCAEGELLRRGGGLLVGDVDEYGARGGLVATGVGTGDVVVVGSGVRKAVGILCLARGGEDAFERAFAMLRSVEGHVLHLRIVRAGPGEGDAQGVLGGGEPGGWRGWGDVAKGYGDGLGALELVTKEVEPCELVGVGSAFGQVGAPELGRGVHEAAVGLDLGDDHGLLVDAGLSYGIGGRAVEVDGIEAVFFHLPVEGHEVLVLGDCKVFDGWGWSEGAGTDGVGLSEEGFPTVDQLLDAVGVLLSCYDVMVFVVESHEGGEGGAFKGFDDDVEQEQLLGEVVFFEELGIELEVGVLLDQCGVNGLLWVDGFRGEPGPVGLPALSAVDMHAFGVCEGLGVPFYLYGLCLLVVGGVVLGKHAGLLCGGIIGDEKT